VTNRHVAADDDRAAAGLDDNDLHAARVAGRRHEPQAGQQLELAIDRDARRPASARPRRRAARPRGSA
jgi:hypothetical protein